MMTPKIKMIDGEEYDMLSRRSRYLLQPRSKRIKAAKRKYNKRMRKQAKVATCTHQHSQQ
jgi:hypothetical protein